MSRSLVPTMPQHLPRSGHSAPSPEYRPAVRKLDQKLNVTNATLSKVPFDLAHWQKVAAEKYPNGLPEPETDDPTQWLFHGHPDEVDDDAAAGRRRRLLGYRWPAELDDKMRLSKRRAGTGQGVRGTAEVRRRRRHRLHPVGARRGAGGRPAALPCWPRASIEPARSIWTTGSATSSSSSTASCSTTGRSSGTSGTAASATASTPWSTTTGSLKATARGGSCWRR